MKEIFKKLLKKLGYRPVYPFSWTNDFWTISETVFCSGSGISESEFENIMAECYEIQEQERMRQRLKEGRWEPK